MTTPILSGFRSSGSTFYTFSSSINDTALLFSSANVRMSFSKYVCLNLPDFKNQTEQRLYRAGADIGEPLTTDPNLIVPKAYLQNYAENLQQFAEVAKTDNTYQNSAELSFWKALRYVSDSDPSTDPATGALQLITDDTYVKPDSTVGQKYREVAKSTNYEPLIQYIGDINTTNHVKSAGQEYMEIYSYIDRTAGKVIAPKFKPHDSMVFSHAQIPDGGGQEYIAGRETQYTNNTDNVKAIYDNPTSRLYDVASDLENLGIDFTEFETRATNDLRYSNENFSFNAILIYYDIWDRTNEASRRRNLYGILFLDRFVTDGTSVIERFEKFAPSNTTPGNAYGLRQNLKWGSQSNQVTSEITVGNELVGLDLYMNALGKLTTATDELTRLSSIVQTQQTQLTELRQIILRLNAASTTT